MSQDQYLIYATSVSLGAGYFEVTDPSNQLPTLQATAVNSTGISSISTAGIAVAGTSTGGKDQNGNIILSNIGVSGSSIDDDGVYGKSQNGTGVHGITNRSDRNYAGKFDGNVHITGVISTTVARSQMDHPLDSANKYLSHSFVESSEMKNIYDGTVTLDAKGEAIVELPNWFEALNKDFRYQLTCIGGYAPVYIAEKLQNKRFKIAGGHAGQEVCWQVTGIRRDAYANAYPLVVEEEKPAAERGYYRHPEVHNQPEEKGIEWARRSESI